ncbi:hypothetical protein EZY14_002660 [Kordia sp. TARA_039_SRF]|nr:hypothetical protein EZY14_002660 [Kordia sp. TARA_039_SRF]
MVATKSQEKHMDGKTTWTIETKGVDNSYTHTAESPSINDDFLASVEQRFMDWVESPKSQDTTDKIFEDNGWS